MPDDLVGFGISASFGVYLCIGFTAEKLEAVSVHALCNKAFLDCSASARGTVADTCRQMSTTACRVVRPPA